MNDEQMRRFPEELGKLGLRLQLHHLRRSPDRRPRRRGVRGARCAQDGMLALARLQRKFRLLESPYRTPQTLVGGPRADAGAHVALRAAPSTTKAMGKGSTQFQHQVQTEVPPKLLEEWLDVWRKQHGIAGKLTVSLRPHSAGSQLLELAIARRRRREGRQRGLRRRSRIGGAQHPLGPRPEHLRRGAPPQAPDDARCSSSSSTATRSTRCTTSRRPTTTSARPRA